MSNLILVTGATGFIGSHLVERLLEAGETVRILVRDRARVPGRWAGRTEVVEGDLILDHAFEEAVHDVDIVVHLAGVINLPVGREETYTRINLEGTQNLFNAVAEKGHKIRRFLYCSSVGVFGPLSALPACEATPCNPSNAYEKSKYEAEKWVLQTGSQHGIPVSVVRPAWVYGPGDRRTLPIFSMIAKKHFIMIGKGETLIHPVYVDDLAEGILQCSGSSDTEGKVVILAGNQAIKLRDFVHLLSEILDVKPWPFHLPMFLATFIALALEILYKPMRKMPPLHRRRLGFFSRNQAFDITGAKNGCGFEPGTTLEEGLRKTITWYKQHGWI